MQPSEDAYKIPKKKEPSSWKGLLGKSHKKEHSRQSDELINIVVKRSADTLKFTRFMMKSRLTEELDKTINSHIQRNPKMRGNYFVGIIVDSPYKTEVVDLDTASRSVIDMDPEEAKKILSEKPMGYFKAEDFTVNTHNDLAYRGLKRKLDSFFQQHESTFRYLRENPGEDLTAESFYKQPGT